MAIGVSFHHFVEVVDHFQRIQHTQGVGKHESLNGGFHEMVHEMEDIVWRTAHAIAPVFKIDVHLHTDRLSIIDGLDYVCNVLIGSLAQLLHTVLLRPFAE